MQNSNIQIYEIFECLNFHFAQNLIRNQIDFSPNSLYDLDVLICYAIIEFFD